MLLLTLNLKTMYTIHKTESKLIMGIYQFVIGGLFSGISSSIIEVVFLFLVEHGVSTSRKSSLRDLGLYLINMA